jgi:hypothetical protein
MQRLIDTVRRECLDWMLVFGETHLRQILSSYAGPWANMCRWAVQRSGAIVAIPILSGLYHHYVRICLSERRTL